MATRTELDTKVLDAIIKNLGGNVANAVAKGAFTVEAKTKINIQQMEAIDTGALLNGTSTSLMRGGTMQDGIAEARTRNPDATIIELPIPRDDHTAYVGPVVEYGPEVHFGNTRMAGRPFLSKAVRETEDEFRKLLADAVVNK
jgi:hypothetical protein